MTSDSVPAIELVPYDEEWPARFERSRDRIADRLPQAEIHHVGSTSVPGLISKPTIDVLVCLDSAVRSKDVVAALTSAGYEYRQQSFAESPERHLFFRDYLRSHPIETAAYATAKRQLLRESRGDRAWYVDNKIPVVDAMMPTARQWYHDQDR